MQLGCLVCPEAGIGGFLVANRMEGHSLVAGVDEVDDMGFVVILRNSLSSAASHISLSVGELFLWKPTLTALRRNDSSWSRWAAFVNPHHAEEAYC